MFRILKCTKDNYLVYKYINTALRTNSNVGQAGTLDLFKLYDETIVPGITSTITETTRLLTKFDYSPLSSLTSSIININSPSFNCELQMFDIYGGQSVPSNFTLESLPLAKSFDEGIGMDIVSFKDFDTSNWITASKNPTIVTWGSPGANSKGGLGGPGDIDVYVSGNLLDGNGVVSFSRTQSFSTGQENYSIDVTKFVSASLVGTLTNHGFRTSFIESEETDNITRFVKRFASRHVRDQRIRPRIIVRYDDSVQDNTSDLLIGVPNVVTLTNLVRGNAQNVLSGSTELTGSNAFSLTLSLMSSSIPYSITVPVSQKTNNGNNLTGYYSSTFTISNTHAAITSSLINSSSLKFKADWKSNDESVSIDSKIFYIDPVVPQSSTNTSRRLVLNVTNLKSSYSITEVVRFRVFCFDQFTLFTPNSPERVPKETESLIFTNMHFRLLNENTGDVLIPFDTTYNSTRLSCDKEGMYFNMYMSDLDVNQTYRLEFMTVESNREVQITSTEFLFTVEK